MFNLLKKPYEWMGASINSPYADYILGLLFYIEAIFFLPTDPILILYCLERRDKAIWYATVALIGSVLGGISSYMLGIYLWNTYGEAIIHNHIINYVLTPQMFYKLSVKYEQYNWLAVAIAGFTPVPYKAATLSAGFCKLSFIPFVISSIISRGARFYLLALMCKVFGEHIKDTVHKYFNLILLFAVLIIVLTVWLFT
ncbi:DedA family protein [Candidatus Dependentiae bacterium]|nr:MAG: DedA family protein [Candidatus Dependentiae bacterium]